MPFLGWRSCRLLFCGCLVCHSGRRSRCRSPSFGVAGPLFGRSRAPFPVIWRCRPTLWRSWPLPGPPRRSPSFGVAGPLRLEWQTEWCWPTAQPFPVIWRCRPTPPGVANGSGVGQQPGMALERSFGVPGLCRDHRHLPFLGAVPRHLALQAHSA